MRPRTRTAALAAATALLVTMVVQAESRADAPSGDRPATVTATTDAARHRPGDKVTIKVQVDGARAGGLQVRLRVTHLGDRAGATKQARLGADGATFTWTAPKQDHRGYLVRADVTDENGTVVGTGWTAVDISTDPDKFPRYGFISGFGENVDAGAVADYLNQHHITDVQFYDWNWKHHIPLKGTPEQPAASWEDMAGRINSRKTVLDLIDKVQDRGADALSYNLVFGADNGYGEDGSGVSHEWGLYKDDSCTQQDGHPLPSFWPINHIYLNDPANPAWQDYFIGKEQQAFAAYPFDGWQADQLGNRGDLYTCGGERVNLAERFGGLLTTYAERTGKKIVFNAVGQYGQQPVADNPALPYLYTEAWPWDGQQSYADLKQVIDDNAEWSGGKTTVLAAYVNNALAESPGTFNTPAVLTADAVIFASGGSHNELGDVQHMLGHPYYPNTNLTIGEDLAPALVDYYNFLVAYENLLRDGVRDTDSTTAVDGVATSGDGRANTVWTFTRAKDDGTEVLHLINLLGNDSTEWRDDAGTRKAPPVQENRTVRHHYRGDTPPTAVNFASPDVHGGEARQLDFTTGSDDKGRYVEFTLPSLEYWDMVWLER